jgi:hypothetical protein
MMLREGIVTTETQKDLDKLGIAKTAREEKIRARDAKLNENDPEHAQMMRLYRKHVLKEPESVEFVPLNTIAPAKPAAPAAPKEKSKEVGSFGD